MKKGYYHPLGFVCVFFLLTCGVHVTAFAATPDSITISQLAKQEGHDPAQMADGIPRSFPLPSSSHNLVANSSLNIGSVEGVDAETVEEFYSDFFDQHRWEVLKKIKAQGFIMMTACKKASNKCIALSASSAGGVGGTSDKMRFSFPARNDLGL